MEGAEHDFEGFIQRLTLPGKETCPGPSRLGDI